jgi:hypothetical protein
LENLYNVKSKGIISTETNENTITTTAKNNTQMITLIRPKYDKTQQKKIRKKDKQSKLIINEVTKGFQKNHQNKEDENTKVIIIESETVAAILEEKPFAITWCSICNKIVCF